MDCTHSMEDRVVFSMIKGLGFGFGMYYMDILSVYKPRYLSRYGLVPRYLYGGSAPRQETESYTIPKMSFYGEFYTLQKRRLSGSY